MPTLRYRDVIFTFRLPQSTSNVEILFNFNMIFKGFVEWRYTIYKFLINQTCKILTNCRDLCPPIQISGIICWFWFYFLSDKPTFNLLVQIVRITLNSSFCALSPSNIITTLFYNQLLSWCWNMRYCIENIKKGAKWKLFNFY